MRRRTALCNLGASVPGLLWARPVTGHTERAAIDRAVAQWDARLNAGDVAGA
jgi:hypothetical protein